MMRGVFACSLFVIYLSFTNAQLPPRLNIPGAVLVDSVPQQRPGPFRPPRLLDASPQPLPVRLRSSRPPLQNAIPIREVRPVTEEEEPNALPVSSFDEEVNKLGISALQSAVRQAAAPEAEPEEPRQLLQFRPERPIPVLRENVRENPPRPLISKPVPLLRPEVQRGPIFRQDVAAGRQIKQELREIAQPVRQQVRQQIPQPQQIRQPIPQPQQVQYRPQPRPTPRPIQYDQEEGSRTRKPVVQILRKFRTDNADGSITWGYENEDGSFKEETLGIDCVTRGKYGYVDPDGVKREYNYETGNKCDEPEEEELDDLPPGKNPQPQGRKPQPQFRPQPQQIQYQ